jgi:osmotically-inducible protein OsmY
MSTRYGDRGFGRYGDSEEDRTEDRDYERETDRGYGDYGTRSVRGGEYGATPRGYATGRGSEYGRGYGYERDYGSRDYGSRDYGSRDYGSRQDASRYGASRYGREGLIGGRASAPPPRRREEEDYGRDYIEDGYSRDHDRGRERARVREQGDERDDVRAFDTDYGRTTSRFYGRSGYDYGRDDYDEREGVRPGYGGGRMYGRHHDDERDPRGRDERDPRGRGGRGWWDRAADEVLSWFGGEGDERRRRPNDPRATRGEGKFRGRGPKNYRRSDERIREEVGDRLTDSEWLDASDVEVNVVAGEVILSGMVDSRYAKRLAEDIAESVSGVTQVQNNLRVPGRQARELVASGTTDSAAFIGTPHIEGATAADTIATDETDIPPTGASRAAGKS